MNWIRIALIAFAMAGAATRAVAGDLLIWTTKAQPFEAVAAAPEQVLGEFGGGAVDFQTADLATWLARLEDGDEANEGEVVLFGAFHGDLLGARDHLVDLAGIAATSMPPTLMALGRLGTAEQKYIPWMHSSYVMVANRRALTNLPAGAELDALTYDDLLNWMHSLAEATGTPKFGLPAAGHGAFRRFVQGYLLPAYAGSPVTRFRSDEAAEGWKMLRELWAATNPNSVNFGSLQEPLLSGEVWVGWDQANRLAAVFDQRPEDFVAFPAPAGLAGRAFVTVLAGLAIPAEGPEEDTAAELLRHLLRPETQIAALRTGGYFPVVDVALPEDLPPSQRAIGAAVRAMMIAPDALPVVPPPELGDFSYRFSDAYTETFDRILLRGEDIRLVLDDEAADLRALMLEAGMPCWPPDRPSEGPCPVD